MEVRVLLLFVLRVTSALEIPVGFCPGGTLELIPAPVPDPITRILWKYHEDFAAEWFESTESPEYYNKFRSRTELDVSTGRLRVRQATAQDSGPFSVEINDRIQVDTYMARVIEGVPDPYVLVKPGPNPNTYVLNCEPIKTQGACLESVSYRWKIGTADWVEFGNKLEINDNETTARAETFTCQMMNNVSDKNSEPEKNPFYRHGVSPGPVAGACVGVAVLLGVFYCVYAFKKKKFPFRRTGNAPVSPSDKEPERDKLEPEPRSGPA